jgi:hypothetical protein
MILVNNPGNGNFVFIPLDHAEWQGCTPTDLVFPFFLFAVGNAMAFVMPRFQQLGDTYFLKKIIKRSILIFTIGLLLNWCPFFIWDNNQLIFKQWTFINKDASGNLFEDGVRILGVLQRIAICYFFAALIAYYFKPKSALIISSIILLAYWAMCFSLGTTTNPYTITSFFGNNIDISILSKNHLLHIDKVDGRVFHFDYEKYLSYNRRLCAIPLASVFEYQIGTYEPIVLQIDQDEVLPLAHFPSDQMKRVDRWLTMRQCQQHCEPYSHMQSSVSHRSYSQPFHQSSLDQPWIHPPETTIDAA